MTNRTAVNRAGHLAALLAMVFGLLGAAPVRAASSVEIEARALVGGRYAIGGWLALSVTLVNDGEPTDGVLSAATSSGTVQRHVEMPAGARKVVSLYVEPDAFQRKVTVNYEESNGTARAEVEVRVLEQSNHQVAVVGDGTGSLRSQLIGGSEQSAPEPLTLNKADIPERPEPLDGIATIVWAADSGTLTDAQRRSLDRWVGDGGNLVVLGGPDWQARTAAFGDLLPVEGVSARDGVPQDALADWTGAATPPSPTATISTGALRDGALDLVTVEDGTVLASMRGIGAGRVVFIGVDMATDAYRGWEGATSFWDRLLPDTTAVDQFFGGVPLPEEMLNSMGNALGTLPSLEVPPAELLLVVIVGYILLIGPISYIVLRRADRREMAWITAPLLVVLFTASSFGIGRTMKGGDVILNQITLVRAAQDAGVATVETYGGLYSPDRSEYDLTVDADALIGRLLATNVNGMPGNGQRQGSAVIEQGEPAHVRDLAIGVSGFEAIHASSIVEHRPALSVAWTSEGDNVVGTVTNNGDDPMVDVAYISSAGGTRVGDIGPGESMEFTIPRTNLNGSSASDQVYGFGGFDTANERERTRALRRQVIDALVGYGGFPAALGSAAGRGPYVIGWRDGTGPLPLEIDSVVAQRYETIVEVVSVRPTPATGEVAVQPIQMGVSIVATGGDASAAGPGTIMVSRGSATVAITLPLEAVKLHPTEVAIVLAPDPSFLMDQGGFGSGSFWPPGITAEVLNPQTGEWTFLGDINQKSRFEIDDPATALSATGRIEVRISTDEEIDPNFGQPTVFVSAQVSGVIGE